MTPNIGHPLCAEGIASFIKAVLMLHHRQTVPFLSAQEPMQHYDFASSPFRFTRRNGSTASPGVIAINCFADGGTNAHVILEAWRETQQRRVLHRSTLPPVLNRVECRTTRSESTRDALANIEDGAVIDDTPDFWERFDAFNMAEYSNTALKVERA
jgi:acyl transferase domain-containing protein